MSESLRESWTLACALLLAGCVGLETTASAPPFTDAAALSCPTGAPGVPDARFSGVYMTDDPFDADAVLAFLARNDISEVVGWSEDELRVRRDMTWANDHREADGTIASTHFTWIFLARNGSRDVETHLDFSLPPRCVEDVQTDIGIRCQEWSDEADVLYAFLEGGMGWRLAQSGLDCDDPAQWAR